MRKCQLCGAVNNKKRKRSTIEGHHISYKPVVMMDLCASCHHIVSNYERNPTVYNTEDLRFAVLKLYDQLKQVVLPEADSGTWVLSIRMPNSVLYTMKQRADGQGLSSIGEYVRSQILKSCDVYSTKAKPVNTASVYTMEE
ncbi:hypothetical protein LCGC14_1218510 [marine sediment metagenome]|uniref:Uncharacterized protein n=1 Tax=marine sediment metagenome TaxID=412755 RepID=A0A0F9NU78_9ZZZZ